MYIHSYQIHNVLNVYRKQLSQGPDTQMSRAASKAPTHDRVELSAKAQRQTLIDQVSTEIVDRIAQHSPPNQFEEIINRQLDRGHPEAALNSEKREVQFTYTTIDENDRKTTNSLPLRSLNPLIGQGANTVDEAAGGTG